MVFLEAPPRSQTNYSHLRGNKANNIKKKLMPCASVCPQTCLLRVKRLQQHGLAAWLHHKGSPKYRGDWASGILGRSEYVESEALTFVL